MIKFLDLKAINDIYEPDLSLAIKRVLDAGWYLQGEEVKAFEQEYASFIGTKFCVGVANGLDALRLILKAYIITGAMAEGDEIIVPANTFIASILAITANRLVPALVEPDFQTYNIEFENSYDRFELFQTNESVYFDERMDYVTNEPTITANATAIFVFGCFSQR